VIAPSPKTLKKIAYNGVAIYFGTHISAEVGNTVLFYVAIMGLWGLWRFIRKQGIDSNYWGALVIAEVVIVLQGALGAYLWISGARLVYGVALLVTVGLVLRAIMTAQGS